MNKKDKFIIFINKQINIKLVNSNYILNNKKNLLYTEITIKNKLKVLGLLNDYKFRFEHHLKNNYWIFLNNFKKNS